jgi:SAM-dependent methyltransferase
MISWEKIRRKLSHMFCEYRWKYLHNWKYSHKIWEYRQKCLSFYERLMGVDFSGRIEPEDVGLDPNTSIHSSPSGDKWLRDVLKDLNPSAKDNILDIGCGKGSAIKIMLKFPFARVDGLEISEHIAKIARSNFRKMRIPSERCRIFTGNASEFMEELDCYNYVYFYNPFYSGVMNRFIHNLHESIARNPRKVTIIYNNPTCHQEIMLNGLFSSINEYPAEWTKIRIYSNRSSQ